LLAVDYQLEIRIDRPADLDRVVEFFERSAYAPEPVDELTIALTPPEAWTFRSRDASSRSISGSSGACIRVSQSTRLSAGKASDSP
jgi:hypothetical protein